MSTGHGRVQRDILKWFYDQPMGERIGTEWLARRVHAWRESVYRALLRLEDEGYVHAVFYEDGGLGPGRQREWRMDEERWDREQSYRKAVVKAITLLERIPQR
ncbi:MAG: hypothetical protein WD770_07830 [Actinomycetota bacterium]